MKNSKTLICINTCNRIEGINKVVLPYFAFCKKSNQFDFILALDGSNKEIQRFAKKNQIPCIYSDRREGIGIAKNRVYKSFKKYTYYFFIDDDAELINPKIFEKTIRISKETNIHHFSLFPELYNKKFYFNKISSKSKCKNINILHQKFGGGQFNFFTQEALKKAGGWHIKWAKYKRWGHTEHSYRVYRNKLCPAPFNVVPRFFYGYLKLNTPPSVSKFPTMPLTKDLITQMEQDLIDKKLKKYPFKTISEFHLNKYARELLKTH